MAFLSTVSYFYVQPIIMTLNHADYADKVVGAWANADNAPFNMADTVLLHVPIPE